MPLLQGQAGLCRTHVPPASASGSVTCLRDGLGKAGTMDRLMQHWSASDLLMDALDGVVVTVPGDEDDRHVAYLSKPPSGLNAFAASFETNVHQNNIRLIAHCKQKDFLWVCRQLAHVE